MLVLPGRPGCEVRRLRGPWPLEQYGETPTPGSRWAPLKCYALRLAGIVVFVPHLGEFGADLGHFCVYLPRAN